jgi:hypothetical protein
MMHFDDDPLLSATARQASISSPDYADVEAENPYSAGDLPLPPIDREIGQQDLDERSKYLTEHGPFVNGARSNLAAAHGRGRPLDGCTHQRRYEPLR